MLKVLVKEMLQVTYLFSRSLLQNHKFTGAERYQNLVYCDARGTHNEIQTRPYKYMYTAGFHIGLVYNIFSRDIGQAAATVEDSCQGTGISTETNSTWLQIELRRHRSRVASNYQMLLHICVCVHLLSSLPRHWLTRSYGTGHSYKVLPNERELKITCF